jgi:uncharacterized short protein YbdD (DUF466 family)
VKGAQTLAGLRHGVSRTVLRARAVWRDAGRGARLACGIGDYEAYVAHRRATHPGEPVLSYAAFFRDRQEARYAGGALRACC